MSATRNTKGQIARKTAPKKAVKKPTKAQREMERREALLTDYFRSISEQTSAILKQGDKLDQIQRDIEQVRTLAYQTRTNSRANTVILNKILEGVDLLKSGSIFMQEVKQHRAQPEEPKAEPWEPKENEWVVCISGFQLEECGTNPRRVIATPWGSESVWVDGTGTKYLPGISCGGAGTYETIIRPATQEEIAEAERQEKLKKLVRGCRVDTPDGEGIYLGHDGSGEGRYPHWVSLARKDAPGTYCFNLDQLTPLT